MIKEWFTARELADIAKERGLKSFPNSERHVRRHAAENGWNDLPDNLCRKRKGVGGGKIYHRSLLPDVMSATLHGIETKETQLAVQNQHNQIAQKRASLIPVTSLRFRQRNAMEARGEILVAIDRYVAMNGMAARREAILMFVRAQDEHVERTEALAKANAGEPLNDRERLLIERPSLLSDPNGFDLVPETLAIANDRCGARTKISRATVYEWFKMRDKGGITALAPALTKEDEPVSEEFRAFLTFYAKPSKPTATEALSAFKKANPETSLTIDQVRYTLKRKLNDIERNVGREGLLTLRSRMAYITRSTENLLPTTIYTADGKTFDAEIEHPVSHRAVKPEITSILDIATRRCVGYAVSFKENVIAVTEALRNSCCGHGIPAIFYVDRGPGYKNKTFDADVNGLMGRLSITKMHALPYNSQAKGIIERFNRTAWNRLARKLPTYLGKEMDKEAAQFVHKQTRSDIKELGTSRLLPSWDEFRALCEEAIAEYNATPHDGLPRYRDETTGKYRHYSPDEFWQLHVRDGFEPVAVSEDEVDDLFRPYEIRVARRSQVFWNNNEYFHQALEAYHDEEVMVGYDFADASKVWVREIDREEGQPGRLICVADFHGNRRDYVPLTAQRAAEEKRFKGRLNRVDKKRQEIEEEFVPAALLDQSNAIPMEPLSAPEAAPHLVVDNKEKPAAAKPKRNLIRTDEELAAWAIENPEKLSENQLRVLRRCLERPAAREVLRMSGIDLEALRNLLRATAA
ncbi:Mu transposase C-terminal domain-containing protein [Martelella mediterranea]|uniref:Putative transposase n=1 Tax=Martelella mediterranea TaxID=293089 RepID=A0A4R3NQE1_9HYPH|nr:Mu transposase C-terminal domain-containing protein [Martelella mediterranea]TCT37670.1 putative transposase [Martelella mediterranea]